MPEAGGGPRWDMLSGYRGNGGNVMCLLENTISLQAGGTNWDQPAGLRFS